MEKQNRNFICDLRLHRFPMLHHTSRILYAKLLMINATVFEYCWGIYTLIRFVPVVILPRLLIAREFSHKMLVPTIYLGASVCCRGARRLASHEAGLYSAR